MNPLFNLEFYLKLITTLFFGFNFTLIIGFIRRNYKKTGKLYEENQISLMILNIIIIIIILIIWTEMKISTATMSQAGLIALSVVLFGTPITLLFILLITNFIQMVIRKQPKQSRYGIELSEKENAEKYKFRLDFQRKLAHISLFFGILIVISIAKNYITENNSSNFFGMSDGSTIITNLFTTPPFTVAQSFIMMVFYVLTSIFLILETTRLSTKIHFPFHRTVQYSLRKEELDVFASYVHMSLGYLFVAFTCPATIFLGVLCFSAFADASASIVGIKFGKHKISVNKKKSWEGAMAGFIVGLISSTIFVGFVWGLCAAILFMILDIYSPEKFKVCDNLSVPILTVILFFIFNLLNIPAMNFINL